MTVGTFLFYRLNVSALECHSWNRSSLSSEDINCQNKTIVARVFFPISLIVLINCVVVICAFAGKGVHSSLKLHLLLLSISEFLFAIFVSLGYVNLLCGVCRYRFEDRTHQMLFMAACYACSDVFLCGRNWCHMIITMNRCERLLLPLRPRRFFVAINCLAIYIVTLLFAAGFVAVRTFDTRLLICWTADREYRSAHIKDYWRKEEWFTYFEQFVYYTYQTSIPVVLTLAGSVAMAVKLLQTSALLNTTEAARQMQMRASKTVLAMAVVFAALELPPLLFSNLCHLSYCSDGAYTAFQLATEVVLLSHSISNTLIFWLSIPEFKIQIKSWLLLT